MTVRCGNRRHHSLLREGACTARRLFRLVACSATTLARIDRVSSASEGQKKYRTRTGCTKSPWRSEAPRRKAIRERKKQIPHAVQNLDGFGMTTIGDSVEAGRDSSSRCHPESSADASGGRPPRGPFCRSGRGPPLFSGFPTSRCHPERGRSLADEGSAVALLPAALQAYIPPTR